MTPTETISASHLQRLGFTQRPDLVHGLVDDCWEHGNVLLFQTFIPFWHVQAKWFQSAAVLVRSPVVTIGQLQDLFFDANGQQLILPPN